MWHRRNRLTPEAAVVAAAEAILEGRAIEEYRDEGLAVPPWALVNTLAHAPVYRLRALAEAEALYHPRSLDAALSRLAACLLAVGPDPAGVVAVQRELLVQVELIVLGHDERSPAVALGELELMLGALLSHRRERRERPPSLDG